MERVVNCPICGESNKETYYYEDIGLVEDYYSCDNCGYTSTMCYSPTVQCIYLGYGRTKLRRQSALEKFKDKLSGIKVLEGEPPI